jgi:hypothetical protein
LGINRFNLDVSNRNLVADRSFRRQQGGIAETKRARRGRRMRRALDPDRQLGGGVLPVYEGALGGGVRFLRGL